MSELARHPREPSSGPARTASWHDTQAAKSFELIRACGLRADEPLIDVSGGSPQLIRSLLEAGFRDVTVLNASYDVLEALREHDGGSRVTLIARDVIGFHPRRRYALWHDRGVFHLLIHPEERRSYVETAQEALRPEGHLVIATFGPEGPSEYQGLPVRPYAAATLAQELGGQFELAEQSLELHRSAGGELHQYLHCRFRRHAPRQLSS
jgi:2-polyprenyl-3-methyl-5-hydroxy-6-metoxy-1,4-benzoquinol methylase